MKTTLLKIMIVIVVVVFFALGCRKTQSLTVGPTLEFVADAGYISTDTTWAIGDTAIIGLRCIWDGSDLVRTIYRYYNSNKVGDGIQVNTIDGEDFTFELKIMKGLNSVERYEFEVVDELGHFTRVGLIITINDTGAEIISEQAIIGTQDNPSNGSCFNFANNQNIDTITAEANQNQIDMVAGYEFSAKSFFTSPGSDNTVDVYDDLFSRWSVKNLTQFCNTTISTAQYSLINKDNVLISSFHEDVAENIIGVLAVNKIYSFRTIDGRHGLIKIISVANNNTESIAFDYKIQSGL